ncbi:MAG: sulfur carrier protein ThiS [Bacteroidota bacterium]
MQIMLPKEKSSESYSILLYPPFLKFLNQLGMEISFNNQLQQIEEGSSVQQLLDRLIGTDQKGIAIAVNQNIVPRTTWGSHTLRAQDKVLVIKATQGG